MSQFVMPENPDFFYTAEAPDAIRQMLSKDTRTIVFRKINGEIREMLCTLDPTIIPPAPKTTTGRVAPPKPPNLISVWDVNANGWRSFYVDSIIEIK